MPIGVQADFTNIAPETGAWIEISNALALKRSAV